MNEYDTLMVGAMVQTTLNTLAGLSDNEQIFSDEERETLAEAQSVIEANVGDDKNEGT